MAIIYNKETKWKSNKGKGAIATLPTSTPISTKAEYNNVINNSVTAKEKLDDPRFSLKDYAPIFEDNPNSNVDTNQDWTRFFKIFEKLAPLIDELDTLLTKYKQPAERIKTLSDTVTQSLMAPNPFKFIKDTIGNHRAGFGFEKASEYIALSENISHQQVKIKIKVLAWNSPYFKKNQANAVYQ